MDNDHDGMIDQHRIDLSLIDNDVLDVLTPLLLSIENQKLQINFSDFLEMVDNYLPQLNVEQRNSLIGPKTRLSRASFTD